MTITVTLDPARYAWLIRQACDTRERPADIASRVVHNAVLDWQMTHYPTTSPDKTPAENGLIPWADED